MAASVRSNCGDVDDDGTLLHPPEPTCWELLSTDSKTPNPNPRPTKTMRMDESSNPPPSSSEAVDLEVPTAMVEDQSSSKEKPPIPTGEGEGEGRAAEPEKAALGDYNTDDDDMEVALESYLRMKALGLLSTTEFVESESESETEEEKAFWASATNLSTLPPVLEYKNCDICFKDHYTAECPYSCTIPYGQKIPNSRRYIILCLCGAASEDGGPCNNKNCVVRQGPRFVVQRDRLIYELKN